MDPAGNSRKAKSAFSCSGIAGKEGQLSKEAKDKRRDNNDDELQSGRENLLLELNSSDIDLKKGRHALNRVLGLMVTCLPGWAVQKVLKNSVSVVYGLHVRCKT